jgi:hypothetical protein
VDTNEIKPIKPCIEKLVKKLENMLDIAPKKAVVKEMRKVDAMIETADMTYF